MCDLSSLWKHIWLFCCVLLKVNPSSVWLVASSLQPALYFNRFNLTSCLFLLRRWVIQETWSAWKNVSFKVLSSIYVRCYFTYCGHVSCTSGIMDSKNSSNCFLSDSVMCGSYSLFWQLFHIYGETAQQKNEAHCPWGWSSPEWLDRSHCKEKRQETP